MASNEKDNNTVEEINNHDPDYVKIECINVPAPGEPPLMIISGQETYQAILERVKTNLELNRSAKTIYVKAIEVVNSLRSLAHLINLRGDD